MVVMLIGVFIPAGWWGYLVIAIPLIIVVSMAKIKYGILFRSLKPMTFMMIFLLIINVLTVHEGTLLLDFGVFAI